MTDKARDFLAWVSLNKEQAKELQTIDDPKELVKAAREFGYELNEADFKSDEGKKVSEEELDAVAGGGPCYCVLGGGGTPTEGHSGACGCAVYGMGYSGDKVRCYCLGYGQGTST